MYLFFSLHEGLKTGKTLSPQRVRPATQIMTSFVFRIKVLVTDPDACQHS